MIIFKSGQFSARELRMLGKENVYPRVRSKATNFPDYYFARHCEATEKSPLFKKIFFAEHISLYVRIMRSGKLPSAHKSLHPGQVLLLSINGKHS